MMTGRRLFLSLVLLLTLSVFSNAQVPVVVQLSGLGNINSVVSSLGATVLDSIPDAKIYLLNVPVSVPSQVTTLISPLLSQMLGIQWFEINTGITLPGIAQLGV